MIRRFIDWYMRPPAKVGGSWSWYILRDLAMGLPTAFIMVQYAGLFWLDRNVKNARRWFALLVVIFVIENLIYQVFVGTIIYWERPRHLQFTQRIQWMIDRGDERALRAAGFLNEHDEKHIRFN